MQQEFDYIIVGAGSAGCVVANRLSADPSNQVCLIEAGPEDKSVTIHMPGGVIALMRDKKLNWQFRTEPDPNTANRDLFWPRGKTLGGSSSINAMLYIRGHREDYDEWAALGNEGWSYDELLPLFQEVENNERGADAFHGVGGELNVADQQTVNPLSKAFVEACNQAGIPTTADFNGEQQEGSGLYQVTQINGERCSAAKAFLDPVKDRQNLTILTDTQVEKLTFEDKVCTGAIVRHAKQSIQLTAKKEVIVSAGAINSPQLLLLSGVGPKTELDKHGIALVHELPGVGENLQDHIDFTLVQHAKTKISAGFAWNTLLTMTIDLFRWLFVRKGLFTSPFAEAGAFFKTDPSEARPDIQLHFIPSRLRPHGLELTFGHGYACHVCILRPESRGRVRLKTANPLDDPSIEPGYFDKEEDLSRLTAGFKRLREIFAQPALTEHAADEEVPGSQVQGDEAIKQMLRERAETVYHPVGTCKMGQDAMAVVDSTLRVHGLSGLRVADASIMPTLIGGNTNAPSMLVGSKAAAMILAGDQPARQENQAPVAA